MESLGQNLSAFPAGKIPGMDVIMGEKRKQKTESILKKNKNLDNVDFS
jgi:hypothetical protein